MTTFTLRPGQMEDLRQAVPMFNLCSQKMIGMDEFDMQWYVAEWTSPTINLERDTRVAITPDSEILGVVEVWNGVPPYVRNEIWARVHPDYEGQGIGPALMEWAEQHARENVCLAESETRIVMSARQYAVNKGAKSLFEDMGYTGIRHSFMMERIMDNEPAPPAIPVNMVIRPMKSPDQYEEMHRVHKESFRDHWGHIDQPFEETFARMMHSINVSGMHDPSLWFVAFEAERIAGVCMCRIGATGDPEMGWVDTLAVRKPYRQKGIGMALLLHAFREFYKRGYSKAGLGVDATNITGALKLYERAGMHILRQSDHYEKELRSGRNLMT